MLTVTGVNLLVFASRLEFNIEIRERLDWMENEDADVFLSSIRMRLAGDIMLTLAGVIKFRTLHFTVVDVDRPIDLRSSSVSLCLIFSLIMSIYKPQLGVFSGWF